MKFFKKLGILPIAIVLVYSCDNDLDPGPMPEDNLNGVSVPEEETAEQDEYFVSSTEAISIASILEFPNSGQTVTTKGVTSTEMDMSTKEVEESRAVLNDSGQTVFYIMNYKSDGFVIVSGDKRVDPILAYGEQGHIAFEKTDQPQGLQAWLQDTNEGITAIKQGAEIDSVRVTVSKSMYISSCHMQRMVYTNSKATGCDDGGGSGCTSYTNTYGPLMSTKWGQKLAYNDMLANLGCSGDGRPPTGCVATAMAQVMRYHEHPSTYNWANMPNTVGTTSTAILMRDAGAAVNMNYTCSESSAYTSDADDALRNDFSYSSATYRSWDRNLAKADIRAGRPVILRGQGTGGHAWVCDGYRYNFNCTTASAYTYYWMNWGWYGSHDGYFTVSDWSPGNHNFSSNKGMIYNIIP